MGHSHSHSAAPSHSHSHSHVDVTNASQRRIWPMAVAVGLIGSYFVVELLVASRSTRWR